MKTYRNKEDLLKYLKHKDGSPFTKEIVDNWYKARAYVLDKLKDVAIGSSSKERLHVLVKGDSPLMLSVVRQVALLAHYANYDEMISDNRTVVTIVSNCCDIVEELQKEEYLSNLLYHCKYTIGGVVKNPDSYIDIELEIVKDWQQNDDENAILMMEDDLKKVLSNKSKDDIYKIDTRKAVLAGRMYDLGVLIDNLPAEDIHCAERYALALDVFQHAYLKTPIECMVNDKNKERWDADLVYVKNNLSNVFCADCFESRAMGMKANEAWTECNEALSKSEHARWVAEKLILGFRPLSPEEHIEDEEKFGDAKKQYRKKLKSYSKDPVHIDLCSYADLRRVNPDDMKYDSFLMLAIPKILKILRIK